MSTNTIDPPISQLTPTRKPGETQRLQTLCIEIPVTVQGSRNTHPSAPFLEETRTVIVFPQGAVVRLAEIVVQGQIVIVQNMRVKQEVACRVISSKPGAAAKGYVELEFTQPAPGFWGISFPGEAIAHRPFVAEPIEEQTAVAAPPAAPMNAPAKLTPETTLELNAAIAASFANLREAAKEPETSQSAMPVIEKKEPAANPPAETRPTTVAETRPAPLAVAPPAPKTVMPPVSRSAPPAASAPMNSTSGMPISSPMNKPSNVPASAPANSPAMPQSMARSESRAQKISKDQAPVTLADSMAASEADLMAQAKQLAQTGRQTGAKTGSQSDWSRAAKPTEATPSAPASDSRRASGVSSQGLTVMSDLGAAPDFGNQLLSAKAAERSRSGKKRMILAAAAAVVIAAGVGSYFWYAKTHGASATFSASRNVSGEGATSAAPNPSPDATATNPQPAPVTAPVSQTSNARQPNHPAANNSAPNNPALNNSGAQGSTNRAANDKSNNLTPIVVNARQPNVLPMRIAAPTAPSRSTASNTVSAPELGNATPPASANANSPGMGSILSNSMPAAPPPAPGRGSATNSTNASVVREPKLISTVLPIYPKAASVRGDVGEVTVDATVNELGRVVTAKAIAGPPTLREAAVGAVSQWRYQPGTLNGKPVTTHVTVKLMFNPKKQ